MASARKKRKFQRKPFFLAVRIAKIPYMNMILFYSQNVCFSNDDGFDV